MQRIFLITFKVLVMSTVNFQLVAATHAESVVSANKKCVDFGFKQNTKDYADCVKQVTQSKVNASGKFLLVLAPNSFNFMAC